MTSEPSLTEDDVASAAEGHVAKDAPPREPIRAETSAADLMKEDEEEGSLLGEFWLFMKEEKKWWLSPIVVVVLLLFTLFVFADSPAAPFIYALF